jgi:hypothetical protein
MNIFSLAEDPVNGTLLNSTCAAKTGIEYVNFAFVTKNGRPTATPNPVQSTTATFTPDPNKDPFMNSDDNLKVSLKDTPHGLQAVINDQTSGQKGSMTASAANGFGQVQYDPTGTSCVNLPYDFHPMYSSRPPTRAPRPPSPRSSARSRTVSRACRGGGRCMWGSATTCPARPPTSAATRSTGRCCPPPT